jgi:hypothetical protein
MDVAINKSGQHRSVAEVNDLPARGRRRYAGFDARDLFSLDVNILVGKPAASLHIEQASCVDDDSNRVSRRQSSRTLPRWSKTGIAHFAADTPAWPPGVARNGEDLSETRAR